MTDLEQTLTVIHKSVSFIITVTSSISTFLPIILEKNMGFSVAASQCLIAPPVCFHQIFHSYQ